MRIMITGATGYIGSCLTQLALKHGHEVVMASRKKPLTFAGSWLSFDLSSDNSFKLPTGIDVIVHLAANTTHTDCLNGETEVVAAKKLIKSSKDTSAKFIFVSSQTARPDAPIAYGRTKWSIEQEVLSAEGWVVRPGQVYGGELRGLFGTLANIVKSLPILPEFVPAPNVQPIHVSDLAEGILRIAERGDVDPGVYCLAASDPVNFSLFIGEIAKSRLRCWRVFVPVPVAIINAIGESLRIRLGLERLSSLFDLPTMVTTSDLKQLGLVLRPLKSGMHPSGNNHRRILLLEGRAMLAYVLKVQPGSAVLRRYIRAIEQLRNGHVLGLPNFYLLHPIFLSLLNKSAWTDESVETEFLWRLDAATILAETTPLGAARFLGLDHKHGMFRSLLSMTASVVCEVFWRILSALVFPLARFFLSHARGAA